LVLVLETHEVGVGHDLLNKLLYFAVYVLELVGVETEFLELLLFFSLVLVGFYVELRVFFFCHMI
jgi:hypothetical protein